MWTATLRCKPGIKEKACVAQEGCDIEENELTGVMNDTDVPRFQDGLGPSRRVTPDAFWARLQTEMWALL